MAFRNGLGPYEDLRPRPSHASTEPSFTFGHAFPTPSSHDQRNPLPRRFTTDLSKDNFLSLNARTSQMAEQVNVSQVTLQKLQEYEQKRKELQRKAEQRKQIELELKLDEDKQRRELEQMERELSNANLAKPVSEPTTPPEYHENATAFPSLFSRPNTNRFSMSSLTSPPGLQQNRISRSGSQITSPGAEWVHPIRGSSSNSKPPAKSVPGSRRNSGESDEPIDTMETLPHQSRSAATLNRYSMPATGLSGLTQARNGNGSTILDFSQFRSNAGFILDSDDTTSKRKSTSNLGSFWEINSGENRFPILERRDGGVLSASSAALDLALSQSPGPQPQSDVWPSFTSNRHSLQALPQHTSNTELSDLGGVLLSNGTRFSLDTTNIARHSNRNSMDIKLSAIGEGRKQNLASPPNTRPTSLTSSFSTNDIPTMKTAGGFNAAITPPKTHAEQYFHKHNASMGRIPQTTLSNNRHSRELSGTDPAQALNVLQSNLQASAAPFGPGVASTSSGSTSSDETTTPTQVPSPYSGQNSYGAYGINVMNSLQMGQLTNRMQSLQLQSSLVPYQNFAQVSVPGRYQDGQTKILHQRRLQNSEETTHFTNVPLDQMKGEIYQLCKDQHGCRYLQKKLEERDPDSVQIIFSETNQHVVELMTDPFGNYLCQKLLEFANDTQRTILISNAAPQMVKIALNQHGTRALQKMIEFVNTSEQIQMMIMALRDRVVELVQDLNGNHVIQKCLTRLSSEDSQFIYDAVGTNCVAVGTHRHGCCVLQRCIDHASTVQKAELISQITMNAFDLVQDPFGNYVVQYILDLGEQSFTEPLCQRFRGSITRLSKQKFSSNVIEKCLRVADDAGRHMIIEEMLSGTEMDRMLKDSFANYVVQTALDYADPEMKTRMVNAIRPILPAIRHTPHGRRIAGKIMGSENQGRLSGTSSGQMTPNDATPQGTQARQSGSTPQFQLSDQNGVRSMSNQFANYFSPGYTYDLSTNFLADGAMPHNSQSESHSAFSSSSNFATPFPAYAQPSRPRGFNNYF